MARNHGSMIIKKEKIRCDACPVMCYVAEGRAGACDRYANIEGQIVRCDPLTILDHQLEKGGDVTPFLNSDWENRAGSDDTIFVTAVGSGTTYPDYKPAPFIVSRNIDDVDCITVVTEAIFSYCGIKVKIDTDRHLGEETAVVRAKDEVIGHVMTSEYGSQMLSLGGVDHLTGGSKAEGRIACSSLLALANKQAVELTIDGGAQVTVQAGKPPIVDGVSQERMRVGCGSAAIGMFASQWQGLVDEVVVVDDHITGVVSEHQAGKVLGWESTGIKIKGRRSTPGRYFQVAEPGLGWGGTNIENPLEILGPWNVEKGAKPGLRVMMVSTTGEHFSYFVLNDNLQPDLQKIPVELLQSVRLIDENCEPSLCSVLFMGGAGGSLRSGATKNPIKLTKSIRANKTRLTCGGAPVFVWPGGGITFMVDVLELPDHSFGYVPTPALVAPLEFTLPREEYVKMGGHEEAIRSIEDILENSGEYHNSARMVSSKTGENN